MTLHNVVGYNYSKVFGKFRFYKMVLEAMCVSVVVAKNEEIIVEEHDALDETIVEAAKNGEMEALELLIKKYKNFVRSKDLIF